MLPLRLWKRAGLRPQGLHPPAKGPGRVLNFTSLTFSPIQEGRRDRLPFQMVLGSNELHRKHPAAPWLWDSVGSNPTSSLYTPGPRPQKPSGFPQVTQPAGSIVWDDFQSWGT